jgi:hypothetical protein
MPEGFFFGLTAKSGLTQSRRGRREGKVWFFKSFFSLRSLRGMPEGLFFYLTAKSGLTQSRSGESKYRVSTRVKTQNFTTSPSIPV